MRSIRGASAATKLACLAVAGTIAWPCIADAHPFLNERPFTSLDLVATQAILDDVAGPGVLDAVDDQSPFAVFVADAFTATLVFEDPWVDDGEGFDYRYRAYEAVEMETAGALTWVTLPFLDQYLPGGIDADVGDSVALDAGGQAFGVYFEMLELCCGDDQFVSSQDIAPSYRDVLAMLVYPLGPESYLLVTNTYNSDEPYWALRLDGVTPIPEPSTGLLLGLGVGVLAARRRRAG